jgi:putative hydrolase of the HAD superfamily
MRMYCFDLDDTLISERDYVLSGLEVVGARIDELTGSRARQAGLGSARWMIAEWTRTRSRDIFGEALARAGLEPVQHRDALIELYRGHLPKIAFRPGVTEVLKQLVARGDRLSIVSDGYLVPQKRKWEALAPRLPFAPVVFTDVRGRGFWKPNVWAFEEVMKACPQASAYIYVGDNPEKDFAAPNRLGWTTVELRHADRLHPDRTAPSPEARARHWIADFPGLLDLLETSD